MLFQNSVRTSKRTPHFTITKINWLTLFKEIIAVYSENHTEPINIKCKSYLMLKRLVHIATVRLQKVKTAELGGKPVPMPLPPPHIPHGLAQARTRTSAMRGRRLTTPAMALPLVSVIYGDVHFHMKCKQHRNFISRSHTPFLCTHTAAGLKS
jgi:hypothetical protein